MDVSGSNLMKICSIVPEKYAYTPQQLDSNSILNEMNANLYRYEQLSVEQLEAMRKSGTYITPTEESKADNGEYKFTDEAFDISAEDKIDVCRPFFLFICYSHLFKPLIISLFGCLFSLLRFLLTSTTDTLCVTLHPATGKESSLRVLPCDCDSGLFTAEHRRMFHALCGQLCRLLPSLPLVHTLGETLLLRERLEKVGVDILHSSFTLHKAVYLRITLNDHCKCRSLHTPDIELASVTNGKQTRAVHSHKPVSPCTGIACIEQIIVCRT